MKRTERKNGKGIRNRGALLLAALLTVFLLSACEAPSASLPSASMAETLPSSPEASPETATPSSSTPPPLSSPEEAGSAEESGSPANGLRAADLRATDLPGSDLSATNLPGSETETSGMPGTPATSGTSGTPGTPATLRFVDVFGEEYETAIDPRIAANPYSPSSYRREGALLSYKDDTYVSRFGIDVSSHQGKIDWKAVKESGVEFAFLRIGYRGYAAAGSLNADKEFERNYAGARAEELDVGVYFFSQAVSAEEAREEADFVLAHLNGRPLQLPVVFDPESILDHEARTDNVSGEQFTENTEVFCEAVKEAGYAPAVYSNMLWEAFELDLSKLAEYPVWYADYEPLPQTPYLFEYWQYSNTGRVRGIAGAVDLDIQFVPRSS